MTIELSAVEERGYGVSRIHATGYGYADVAAGGAWEEYKHIKAMFGAALGFKQNSEK